MPIDPCICYTLGRLRACLIKAKKEKLIWKEGAFRVRRQMGENKDSQDDVKQENRWETAIKVGLFKFSWRIYNLETFIKRDALTQVMTRGSTSLT